MTSYEDEWDINEDGPPGTPIDFPVMDKLKAEGLSAEELDNLVHHLTAIRLVERLHDPDCTAGDLQVACRFLKDNDITALAVPKSAQEMLRKKLGPNFPFKTGTEE